MQSIGSYETTTTARIKVVGVGGGGGNALDTMIRTGLDGVQFIAANTDIQAVENSLADNKVQLGVELTRGLGAGADPKTGYEAAVETADEIRRILSGTDMVFIAAGMGGGTGTGAAPVIASIAKEVGALTVGVVTKPFRFEGARRSRQAAAGISALQHEVDTLITIPNQRLLAVIGQSTSMLDAFKKVDQVLLNAVRGISDLVVVHGIVNVDFADVRAVMAEKGQALMGTGTACGERKATEAARLAISSPLLEDANIDGAMGILINITGSSALTLMEIDEATTLVMESAHPDANIIFGSVLDESLADSVRVTVIATGFSCEGRTAKRPWRKDAPANKEEYVFPERAKAGAETAHPKGWGGRAIAERVGSVRAEAAPPLQPRRDIDRDQPDQDIDSSARQEANSSLLSLGSTKAKRKSERPTIEREVIVQPTEFSIYSSGKREPVSRKNLFRTRSENKGGSSKAAPRKTLASAARQPLPDEREMDIPTFLRRKIGEI